MFFNLDNVRLRQKMLILYFCGVFAPILLTNAVFYYVTTEQVRDQRMKDITQTVEQIKIDFRAEIDDAIGVSFGIYTDYLLNDILEESYEHPAEYIYAYDSYIRRILNSYTPIYNAVQSITVYVDNPSIVPSGGSIEQITDEVRQEEWYRWLQDNRVTHPMLMRTERTNVLLFEKSGVKDKFSVIRVLDNFRSSSNWTKIVRIDFRQDTIRHIFSNQNLPGDVYLLNKEGEIQYSTRGDISWMTESVYFDSVEHGEGILEFTTDFPAVNYMEDWRIVALVPEAHVLEALDQPRKFVVLLTTVILLIPTLVILWMVKSLNTRIKRLLKQMKRVKNQQFEIVEEKETHDEIGQLTSEFNRMTLQISNLINDVYAAEIHGKNLELQRRQAQLNALQSQINPHFIFNSLETIRMRSITKKEQETAKIIHNMAKILRNSLSWRKDIVTIREELELIQCFLEIQQYRFGDRMSYEYHIDKAALDCQIPKMTLLPFIENASIHGIEKVKANGRIDLSIRLQGGMLQIGVKDNGIGMDEAVERRLNSFATSEADMGDRIGVQNVVYRLKLYYDEAFQFRINSTEGEGTEVVIVLPAAIDNES